jgi:transcriptional regulator with XRE-family HTH domain
MNTPTLGNEIRRLRFQAGMTLRGFSKKVRVSAAHLSDIEHNRRRPSEALLRRIASQLRKVGTTFDALEQHVTGLDPATRDWVATTPGARTLLRTVAESGRDPREILPALEMIVRRKSARDRKTK